MCKHAQPANLGCPCCPKICGNEFALDKHLRQKHAMHITMKH
jgi:hypothetical protein